MSLKTVGFTILILYLFNILYEKIEYQNSIILYQQSEISDLKLKLSRFDEPEVVVINAEPVKLRLFNEYSEEIK